MYNSTFEYTVLRGVSVNDAEPTLNSWGMGGWELVQVDRRSGAVTLWLKRERAS